MTNNNYVLYVFVNTDMPSMNPGKMAAHSGHAANAFIHQHVVKPLMAGQDDIRPAVKEWIAMTPFGFGTQINLKGNWYDVVKTVSQISEDGVGLTELIIDPTYPYIVDSEIVKLINPDIHTIAPIDIGNGKFACHRQEETAVYIFGDKTELEPYLSKYPLHP